MSPTTQKKNILIMSYSARNIKKKIQWEMAVFGGLGGFTALSSHCSYI